MNPHLKTCLLVLCIVCFTPFCVVVIGADSKEQDFVIPPEMSAQDFARLPPDEKAHIRKQIKRIFDEKTNKLLPAAHQPLDVSREFVERFAATYRWLENTDDRLAKRLANEIWLPTRRLLQYYRRPEAMAREDVRQNYSLPPKQVSAKNYANLSAEKKADILCDIAESSFKLLINVPGQGLRDSQNSFGNVIAARKWLEKTDDVVARMLAISLHHAVDICVFNEMLHFEKHRHGRTLDIPFKPGSFDNQLLTSILKRNEINEHEYISFTLSLDTEVATFCRQNRYVSQDFLSGRVFGEAAFQEAPDEVTFITDMTNYTIYVGFGPYINSKGYAKEMLLPMTLGAIDEARDIRLVATVLRKHGGIVTEDAFKEPINQAQSYSRSNSLKSRFQENMASRGRRFSTKDSDVGFLNRFAELSVTKLADDLYDEKTGLRSDIALRLYPFVRDVDLFAGGGFFNKGRIVSAGTDGIWLDLPE